MTSEPLFPHVLQQSSEQILRPVFETAADAAAYLNWKRTVPAPIRSIVERVHKGQAPEFVPTGLDLTDAFMRGFADGIANKHVTITESMPRAVQNNLKPLERVQISETDVLNVFASLADPNTSWQLKHDIYEKQVQPAVEWLTRRDIQALQKRLEAQQQELDEQQPSEQHKEEDEFETPPTSEHVMSSMEAGEDGENSQEGERARAQFTVSPYRGGRYKQRVFHAFDLASAKWIPHKKTFDEPHRADFDATTARVMSGKIQGHTKLALPFQENWIFDPSSIVTSAPRGTEQITQDQNGMWYLEIDAPGSHTYTIQAGRALREQPQQFTTDMEISGKLPDELEKKTKELQVARLPKLKQAREMVKFIRSHLKYSNSKDAWNEYVAQPSEFFTTLWTRGEADCFVSNTLACRALHALGVDVQFVGGYFVKEKNERGDAVLHGSNGHAWLEVWDAQSARLVTLDATPAGDPTMDEKQQEQENEGESEGDVEPADDEIMSEKEVEEKLEELEEKEDKQKPREKKTPKDREAAVFAGLAECSAEQAREYLAALERVRAIKDMDGTPISEKLIDEWRKLIEERKIETHDYRGPVRMSEGDRLDDPVSAVIDVRSGEFDPTGFEKDVRIEHREKTFGGIALYFSFDLSGSMSGADGASGRSKASVQRDTALLFIDSIMQCAYLSDQSASEMPEELPIKIMATLASDTGSIALPLTNKWGPREQWAIYSALTRTASGGTPTEQTLSLIEAAYLEEKLLLVNKNIPEHERPLNYTMVITDGEPNDASATERARRRLVQAGMVTRTYAIGGHSRSPDAAPPLATFADLPPQLAHDILEEFKKLRPDRIAQ